MDSLTSRRFIRDYRGIAIPLTRLTSMRSFAWNPEAESAFYWLKNLFTSTPILTQPDPTTHFIVVVDASNTEVEAVLSQRLAVDAEIHLCAFFHCQLTATEINYDIDNHELLVTIFCLLQLCAHVSK